MSLSRLYPSAPFEHFFGDFPRMHGPYPFGSLEETHTSRAMQPKMDLYEHTDKNLMTATFELPGLTKNNVNIDVQNGNLAISGESSQSSEQQEQAYTVKERKFGRFVRTIRLPDGTSSKDVQASMKDGVLTVTYPKSSPGQETQRITIE